MKFGTQLAFGADGKHVSAAICSRDDGPFTCVICNKTLTLRAGKTQKPHFIHKSKSTCEGNNDEHRVVAGSIENGLEPTTEPVETPEMTEISLSDLENPETKPVDVPANPETPAQNPYVVETTVPEEVSNSIIDDALDFVVNEVLKEKKCSDCKQMKPSANKMFSAEAMEKFGLNDLYVCDDCTVTCPACSGVNSKKREKRTPLCFTCDFEQNQWVEDCRVAVDSMGSVPDCPSWMVDKYHEAKIKVLIKKKMGRTIYNFMVQNKDRVSEYRNKVGDKHAAKKLSKALKRARDESEKGRDKNKRRRERAAGPVATERYNSIYNNKMERCFCDKQNRRRHMVRYESVMGSVKYSCKSCSVSCKGCNKPCTKRDMERFEGKCFPCYCWSVDRTNDWKNNSKGVLQAASKGQAWAMATLFQKSPTVMSGKYSEDLLVNVPSSEIDSVVRRNHPEMKQVVDVIKSCRKCD